MQVSLFLLDGGFPRLNRAKTIRTPEPGQASQFERELKLVHGSDGVAGPRHTLPPKGVTWITASLAGSNSTRWMFEKGSSSKARQVFPLSRESQRPAPRAASGRITRLAAGLAICASAPP